MNVEKIFRKIPEFSEITMDIILFESKYPVMFTCKNNGEIYLFICCLVSADKVKWIGTRTDYNNLIELLENRITIRDAFLNVTDEKQLIEYDGLKVSCFETEAKDIPDKLLPIAGEYMDTEEGEFDEEIKIFQFRNQNFEYKLPLFINQFYAFDFGVKKFNLPDEFFNTDLKCNDKISFNIMREINRNVKYA